MTVPAMANQKLCSSLRPTRARLRRTIDSPLSILASASLVAGAIHDTMAAALLLAGMFWVAAYLIAGREKPERSLVCWLVTRSKLADRMLKDSPWRYTHTKRLLVRYQDAKVLSARTSPTKLSLEIQPARVESLYLDHRDRCVLHHVLSHNTLTLTIPSPSLDDPDEMEFFTSLTGSPVFVEVERRRATQGGFGLASVTLSDGLDSFTVKCDVDQDPILAKPVS